jgi:hypothetical protein
MLSLQIMMYRHIRIGHYGSGSINSMGLWPSKKNRHWETSLSGRDIYLVGLPMKNAEEVFQQISAALGSRVERIPDGEIGERRDWITWLEQAFDQNPAKIRRSLPSARKWHGARGRYALKPRCRP